MSIKIVQQLRIWLVVSTLVLAGLTFWMGCGDYSDSSPGHRNYLVRIQNQTEGRTFTVMVGPADYGEVGPQEVTEYFRVNEGENTVTINGEPQERFAWFGQNLQSEHRWTLSVTLHQDEITWGYSTDDLQYQ